MIFSFGYGSHSHLVVLFIIFRKPEGKIEWRDALDLVHIIYTHTPQKSNCLGILTTSPDGLLGYVDASPCVSDLVWIDCKRTPPEPSPPVKMEHYHTVHTGMCSEEKNVFIATFRDCFSRVGLYAYNTETHTELWEVKKITVPETNPGSGDESEEDEEKRETQGIVVDGKGHIFVCDINKSVVHLYSSGKGTDLGIAIKEGQHGIGKPFLLSWNNTIPSLIVAHKKNNKNVLSVLKVNYS